MTRRPAVLASALLIGVLSSACSGSTEEPSATLTAVSEAAIPSTSAESQTAGSASPSPAAASPSTPSVAHLQDSWVEVARHGESGGWEHVTSVVHGGAGFLATVQRVAPGHSGPGPVDQYLLVSPDGSQWERAEYPAGREGAESVLFLEPFMTADGRYALIGSSQTPEAVASLVAFGSTDGHHWEPLEMTGIADDARPWDIAVGARGYLLLDVSGADNQPTLWLSSDGLQWEAVHEFGGPLNTIGNLAAGPEGFVVVGFRWLTHPEHETFALASGDGRTWQETLNFVAHAPEGFVTDPRVGSLDTGWVAMTPHPENRTLFWVSEDGITWERAGDVSHGAIGRNAPALEDHYGLLFFNPNTGHESPHPGTWATRDATSWEILHETAIVSGIASGDGVTVIVGSEPISSDHTQAVIWRQADD